jgi:hypothetical protein
MVNIMAGWFETSGNAWGGGGMTAVFRAKAAL